QDRGPRDRSSKGQRGDPDQGPAAPSRQAREAATPQPTEADPAGHEAEADQTRGDGLGNATCMREHPDQACFLLEATSATIATIRPIAPTTSPIRPIVLAREAAG